eukprot:11251107-Alexandrium_andersonii.AAC.1
MVHQSAPLRRVLRPSPLWACGGRELRYWSANAALPNAERTETRAYLETCQRDPQGGPGHEDSRA